MSETLGKSLIYSEESVEMQPEPCLWVNPDMVSEAPCVSASNISMADVLATSARLDRFAPVLITLFPEVEATGGVIESQLLPLSAMPQPFLPDGTTAGRLWIKADHALPIAGSIKARGGIHEVLEFAESLALAEGLLDSQRTVASDYSVLTNAAARSLFARYEISVGSTGNLGLSIGIMASALGFRVTVHMSSDAKQWKKDKLRANGVVVVEHAGDYAQAVQAGRQRAESDEFSYFVDDEHSLSLFLGYSVAALRLQTQLAESGIVVDASHPLFIYLPCGVGGAPAGITFGCKLLFGNAVHCFFIEPTASACFLASMKHPEQPGISVYDLGMNNRTEADGLAVPVASELAIAQMRPLLSGVATTPDSTMFADLYRLNENEGMKVEPSAAAAVSGPRMLLHTAEGIEYLRHNNLLGVMAQANHIVWSTGGLFVPAPEYAGFLERGQAIAESAQTTSTATK